MSIADGVHDHGICVIRMEEREGKKNKHKPSWCFLGWLMLLNLLWLSFGLTDGNMHYIWYGFIWWTTSVAAVESIIRMMRSILCAASIHFVSISILFLSWYLTAITNEFALVHISNTPVYIDKGCWKSLETIHVCIFDFKCSTWTGESITQMKSIYAAILDQFHFSNESNVTLGT